jgi:hypothetical protein
MSENILIVNDEDANLSLVTQRLNPSAAILNLPQISRRSL